MGTYQLNATKINIEKAIKVMLFIFVLLLGAYTVHEANLLAKESYKCNAWTCQETQAPNCNGYCEEHCNPME